ncbi:MAG: S1-like domain-containing RNA-binding protein [Pseudomonadota bacterium]
MNRLKVIKEVDFGLYLDGEVEEILIPKRYVPENTQVGDILDVFLYRDSQDRLLATTETPKAMVDQYAYLEVKEANKYGVFLDWGLPKDLLVPFQEQNGRMAPGKSYLVRLYIDQETNRIVASARIEHFLEKSPFGLIEGQKVNIIPFKYTDLGVKVIVNGQFEGLLYNNEIFESLQFGKEITGFVKKLRENGKIDIRLKQGGYQSSSTSQIKIMNKLVENNGFLPYHDKSEPESIYNEFQMSKRDFKQAIGGLFKENKIKISPTGISIIS